MGSQDGVLVYLRLIFCIIDHVLSQDLSIIDQ